MKSCKTRHAQVGSIKPLPPTSWSEVQILSVAPTVKRPGKALPNGGRHSLSLQSVSIAGKSGALLVLGASEVQAGRNGTAWGPTMPRKGNHGGLSFPPCGVHSPGVAPTACHLVLKWRTKAKVYPLSQAPKPAELKTPEQRLPDGVFKGSSRRPIFPRVDRDGMTKGEGRRAKRGWIPRRGAKRHYLSLAPLGESRRRLMSSADRNGVRPPLRLGLDSSARHQYSGRARPFKGHVSCVRGGLSMFLNSS